jgi:hypothetical protein
MKYEQILSLCCEEGTAFVLQSTIQSFLVSYKLQDFYTNLDSQGNNSLKLD